ncbi:hypothetical protein SAMN04487897_106137 [Paenibacillus sp. yr247]|uniref:hypothetical protein n=1 Tax=Paenibacillus sp. yr247 TaxID=1761880 RepID=UPI00088E6AD6|nr:hypothetical protein [Paenibacillus sp. yr247]SDN96189.1 hypothetical protein SAMN04487897_106137 [Paenibacillus sp. yr247]
MVKQIMEELASRQLLLPIVKDPAAIQKKEFCIAQLVDIFNYKNQMLTEYVGIGNAVAAAPVSLVNAVARIPYPIPTTAPKANQ